MLQLSILSQALCVQLTDIKAMLGVTGQRRVIMGCITQPEVGRYALMDPSGTLPLDLSSTRTTSGFYTGEITVIKPALVPCH